MIGYEQWVERVADALHETCRLEWRAIVMVDPKRQITQHGTDAHYGTAHDLVRRLDLARPAVPEALDVDALRRKVNGWRSIEPEHPGDHWVPRAWVLWLLDEIEGDAALRSKEPTDER